VDPSSIETVDDVLRAAQPAYAELIALGEDVEDEWSYVNDLSTAWIDRIAEVSSARGAERAPAGAPDAVAALVVEAARIDDAHRAIDWLSTFPQVLLIAVGERP
jgi:hypothetical protein